MSGSKQKVGNALLVIEKFEPFEQALFDALKGEGARPMIYHMATQEFWVPGDDAHALRPTYQASSDTLFLHRREVEEVCRRHAVTRSISVGPKVAVAFAKISPGSVRDHAVFSQDDFEFSPVRNPERAGAVQQLDRYFEQVFCCDELQFTAACDKGSNARHFTLDVPVAATTSNTSILAENCDVIAVIHTNDVSEDDWSSVSAQLADAFPGKRVRAWSEGDFVAALDCGVGTSLSEAVAAALSDVSHVAYMGLSRNSRPILRVLHAANPKRVAVVDHIAYRLGPWDMDQAFNLTPSAGVAQRLKNPPRTLSAPSATSLLSQIDAAGQLDVPKFYEDFSVLGEDGPLSVFFSVTPVQPGALGARVQRIRNMFRAFQRRQTRPIPISSPLAVLERRLQLVEYLIAKGRKFSFFYGENSTAPMSRYRSVVLLERLMRAIRAHGGRLAWFIRDLHFMDAAVWRKDGQAEMVDRLHLEYAAVGRNTDIFYAPTNQSLSAFRSQLPKQARPETEWKALPPGMPALTQSPANPSGENKITFVYSGGLGPVYKMDRYLKAVKALENDPRVQFDFIVRPAEQHVLEQSVVSTNAANVRLLNGTFADYQTDTRHVVGIVLLDSGYANAGFPLKVAHYAARRVPILYFETAAFADFLDQAGIGFPVAPTDKNVLETMNSIIARALKAGLGISDRKFEQAYERNSWDSRADRVLDDLGIARVQAKGLIDRVSAAVSGQ